MSTPNRQGARKQWNPDAGPKEREKGQEEDFDAQRADPRERPELYRKPGQRVVTSEPGRKPARKDG